MGKPELSPRGWERAWEAAERYRGFLRTLAARFQGLLLADGAEDTEDLLQAFVVDKLPWIVGRLDGLASDGDRERYLVVAFKNFARSHRRAAQRYRYAIGTFAGEQSEAPEVVAELGPPIVVATGPHAEEFAPALRAFWDLGGDIRQVAQVLGISRYAARKAIVDGALVLALRLGHEGLLDAREVAVCTQALLHGLSVDDTAELLGITETQVKHALASARAVMGHSFKK